MKRSQIAWRIVAPLVATFFFWLALRSDVAYATSPGGLSHLLFGASADGRASALSRPAWLSLHIVVRKLYSIVAFTIVGFCANEALGPARRPVLRATLLVAAYSLAIEIGQRLVVGVEPILERIFDVGCGAVGGWLALACAGIFRRTTGASAAATRNRDPLAASSGCGLE